MDTYTILIMVTVSQMYTNVKKNTKQYTLHKQF